MGAKAMSAVTQTDPVSSLYLAAEAMRHLAVTLPEDQGGLAHIIGKLGEEVHRHAAVIDDNGFCPPVKTDE